MNQNKKQKTKQKIEIVKEFTKEEFNKTLKNLKEIEEKSLKEIEEKSLKEIEEKPLKEIEEKSLLDKTNQEYINLQTRMLVSNQKRNQKLFESGKKFSDVVIQIGEKNQEFYCYKGILACQSLFFSKIFFDLIFFI
ncbi:speckle-type poz protein [Anaeramoeba ignava]|uniref:Speckle-type poz protein n=1 Tax=Anaeramoeba ignava TaxID=1746090 RepID=A0A9Q0LJW1_ANAIG|nr:speckle-type poz protein [Anaeramoeba ignava]